MSPPAPVTVRASPDPPLSTSSVAGPDLVAAFAPTGALRASINLGNPILAEHRPGDRRRARRLGRSGARHSRERLGVPLELVVFDTAGQVGRGGDARAGRHRLLRDRPGARRRHRLHRALRADRGLLPGARRLAAGEQRRGRPRRPAHHGRRGQRLRPVPHARAEAGRDRARADVAGGGRHVPRARARRRRRREAAARGRCRSASAGCACCPAASW